MGHAKGIASVHWTPLPRLGKNSSGPRAVRSIRDCAYLAEHPTMRMFRIVV